MANFWVVIMTSCHHVIMSSWHYVIMSSCHHDMSSWEGRSWRKWSFPLNKYGLSWPIFELLSWHDDMMTSCHHVIMWILYGGDLMKKMRFSVKKIARGWLFFVIMTSCHHVIMSSCHYVIMSSCHHVIMPYRICRCCNFHMIIWFVIFWDGSINVLE